MKIEIAKYMGTVDGVRKVELPAKPFALADLRLSADPRIGDPVLVLTDGDTAIVIPTAPLDRPPAGRAE